MSSFILKAVTEHVPHITLLKVPNSDKWHSPSGQDFSENVILLGYWLKGYPVYRTNVIRIASGNLGGFKGLRRFTDYSPV